MVNISAIAAAAEWPRDSEHTLFVANLAIALREQIEQSTLLPDLVPMQTPRRMHSADGGHEDAATCDRTRLTVRLATSRLD